MTNFMGKRNAENRANELNMASILDSANTSVHVMPSIKAGKGYVNALLQKKCTINSPYSSISSGFGGPFQRQLNIP